MIPSGHVDVCSSFRVTYWNPQNYRVHTLEIMSNAADTFALPLRGLKNFGEYFELLTIDTKLWSELTDEIAWLSVNLLKTWALVKVQMKLQMFPSFLSGLQKNSDCEMSQDVATYLSCLLIRCRSVLTCLWLRPQASGPVWGDYSRQLSVGSCLCRWVPLSIT